MEPKTQAWQLDLDDPRAPTPEQWAALSPDEREGVFSMLPADPESLGVSPEGDPHYDVISRARDSLRRWFRRRGTRTYVGVDKAVYYDGEPVFAPDVFAVLDVDPGPRWSWIVRKEGRGLDFVLEVFDRGKRHKDLRDNVERYARLGIGEYFVFDMPNARLFGWRLADDGRYERLVQQLGLFQSEQLDLELGLEGERVRFYASGAPLPDHEDLLARLGAAVDHVTEQAEAEARRADEEARRAEDEARRADELAERLAAAEAELRRLRDGGGAERDG